MGLKNNSPSNTRKTILVTPLDWGLGHTTRCIPVIKKFLEKDCKVILAGDKSQEILLKGEFPGIDFLQLGGYGVKYGRTGKKTIYQLLVQTPGILKSIKKENEWLAAVIKEKKIDAVISDNRFGLHNKNVPCVFITHQLGIASPFGRFSESWIRKKNYSFINRFTACWVPDFDGGENLAGRLSHPEKLPLIPVKYLGPLSRFEYAAGQKENGLLIILSGPEPQRSIFENIILKELENYDGTATIVRGLPGGSSYIPSTTKTRFYNHLPANELEMEIRKSSMVVSRCGYSTVMDMMAMKMKSVFVPTPGQTEQLYLAKHLSEKGMALCMGQQSFSIEKTIKKTKNFTPQFIERKSSQLFENTVSEFLSSI